MFREFRFDPLRRRALILLPSLDGENPGAPGGGGGAAPAASAQANSAGSGTSGGPSAAPGPSSVPSSAPTPAPSVPSALPGQSDAPDELSFDPSFLGGIFDAGGAPPASAEAPPPAAPQPAVPPAQAPAAPPQPQVPPVESAPAQPAASGPQGERRQPLSYAEPGNLAQALVQYEAQAIDHIAATMYALSQEEVTALDNDVVATIPKLFAKAHVKLQQQFLTMLQQSVPLMTQQLLTGMQASAKNEQKFFSRWKGHLDPSQHRDAVLRFVKAYRAAHPNVPTEQMIEEVGPMVIQALKIPYSGAPQHPLAPNGQRPPQPPPFQPSHGMAPAASPNAVPPEGSEYMVLGMTGD